MRARRFAGTLAVVAASGLWGCTGIGASPEHLVARATFDLECPQPEVQVHDLGDRVRGVVGCGRRLSYVEVCETRPDGTHCAWVINAPAWAYGPPLDKRPPTPPGTWMYTTPPPAPSAQPPGPAGPPRPAGPPSPAGSTPPPGAGAAPAPAPGAPPPQSLPPEPFPTDPGPTPLPPESAPPSDR